MHGPSYSGVRCKNKSWRAQIHIDGIKRWLGHWLTAEIAAHAYDYLHIQNYKDSLVLKFPEDREKTCFFKPEGIIIVTMAQEREHCQVEQRIYNPFVVSYYKQQTCATI